MKVYHNPPHIFLDQSIYMLTGHTYKNLSLFDTDIKKEVLKETFTKNIIKFHYKLYAWVILDNHYHLLLYIGDAKTLSKFINLCHGSTSYIINKMDKVKGRKVWYNYWDSCVREEKDFYTRLNYIHYNPIKHKYIKDINNLCDYKFSSYNEYIEKFGEETMDDWFSQYPVNEYEFGE